MYAGRASGSGVAGAHEVSRWVRDLAPWDALATLTWRPPDAACYDAQGRLVSRRGWPDGPTVDAAHRHLQGWADRCSIPAVFYALETGPIGGRLHAHALVDLGGQPLRGPWRDWHERFGRSTVTPILPGERTAAASRYCAKYVSQEMFMGGPLLWAVRIDGQPWN